MDTMDRILLSEEQVTPSPGFTDSVMRAVRECCCRVGPIGFPWLRFAMCLLAGLVSLSLGAAALLNAGTWNRQPSWINTEGRALSPPSAGGMLWTALAIVGILLVVRFSIYFMSEETDIG